MRRLLLSVLLAVPVLLCGLTRAPLAPATVPELQLTVLGTGAAWPVPRLGCCCGTCDAARNGSPRTRRMRSSLKIGRDAWLLADVGPDAYRQLEGLPVPRPRAVLLTHTHHDHCAGVSDLHPLVKGVPIPLLTEPRIFTELCTIAPWAPQTFAPRDANQPVTIGPWTVRDFPLEHGSRTVGFRVEAQGHAIAYVTDVDRVPDVALPHLQRLDLMVLDGTNLGRAGAEHIGVPAIRALLAATRPRGVLFTHVGHDAPPHEQLGARVRAAFPGADVAYDGLTVEVPR